MIVENKPGANGNVGADFVARSTPDGYTLLRFAATTSTIRESCAGRLCPCGNITPM